MSLTTWFFKDSICSGCGILDFEIAFPTYHIHSDSSYSKSALFPAFDGSLLQSIYLNFCIKYFLRATLYVISSGTIGKPSPSVGKARYAIHTLPVFVDKVI